MNTVKRPRCCQVSGCGLCSLLVGCGAWPSSALVVGCRRPWWWWWALISIGGVLWWAIIDIDGGWWWDLAAGHVAVLLLHAVAVIWLSSLSIVVVSSPSFVVTTLCHHHPLLLLSCRVVICWWVRLGGLGQRCSPMDKDEQRMCHCPRSMATGRDQLRYHGKHRYLSTAELHARYNYYKILFSHINYSLAACKCRAPTQKNSTISCLFVCKFVC